MRFFMKNRHLSRRTLCVILCALLIAVVAGCAAPKQKAEQQPFYPPPPELPRIKYLTYFTSEKDLSPSDSAFDKFVIGEKRDLRLDKPYGVAVYDGKIYVADSNATVMVLDLENRKLSTLKGAQGLGKLIQPLNIFIDRDGSKYVTDPVRGQVVVFGKDDLYKTAFGLSGQWKPADAVVFEDLLYVADLKNNMVKVLNKNTGELVREIGRKGPVEENLGLPTNLAFDSKGTLYVTDAARLQVVKYDRDGHFIGTVGKAGANAAHFARPRGIALDRKDRLYVADASFNNVQIFDPEGHLLLFFSKGGVQPGDLYVAAKVAVDYDNIRYFQKYAEDFDIENVIIVTSQFDRRLVNVYAMGKLKGQKYPTDAELLEQFRQKIEKEEATFKKQDLEPVVEEPQKK
jgi:DNA-binding beta-propeller fold protein YncE